MNGSPCDVSWLPLRRHLLAAGCLLLVTGCHSASLVKVSNASPFGAAQDELLHPGKRSPVTKAMVAQHHRGSTPLEIVKQWDAKAAGSPALSNERLTLAEILCDEAARLEKKQPVTAVGWYLQAAETAYPGALESHRKGTASPWLTLYNHACSETAKLSWAAFSGGATSRTFEGPLRTYQINVADTKDRTFAPSYFDEIRTAENLKILGYQVRETVTGIGGALVGGRRHTPERAVADPLMHSIGMELPVTATLQFAPSGKSDQVLLSLHDVLMTDKARLGPQEVTLAADFTAPLALLAALNPPKNAGKDAMLHPAKHLEETGLFQVEPLRSNKIPVILVHGLSKTPAVWAKAINQLRSDPEIREHYQFICFGYPSGFPAVFCGAALRHHLEEFQRVADPDRQNPLMKQTVLVGKSYGGVLSSLQIRDSGETLRELFVDRPLESIALPEHQRHSLESMLYFQHNPNIARTIFLVTPHRGTDVADKPIVALANRIIRYPADILFDGNVEEFPGLTELGRATLHAPPTSVMNLKAHSPILESVKSLPIGRKMPLHSIIGKIGDKPLPESNDKMVPYWSSHLDEAVSEIVVPTKHGHIAHHPDSIEEMRRILRLHLAELPGTARH